LSAAKGKNGRVTVIPEFSALESLVLPQRTGNLDPRTADHVFGTLAALVKATGLASLIATHNMDLAARMDRRVTIRDGQVAEVGRGYRGQARGREPQQMGRRSGARGRLLEGIGAAPTLLRSAD
jgi:ABC-type lipoprotein export system ATPase subunit